MSATTRRTRRAAFPMRFFSRKTDPPVTESSAPFFQPKTDKTVAPAIVSKTLQSNGGQPIDASTRQFMEIRFGQDFGQVRIHTDTQAAESAAAIQAKAYTSGKDIVFGAGEYRPESDAGRRLLAHELAHVGQQGKVSRKIVQCQPALAQKRINIVFLMGDTTNDPFYKEANGYFRGSITNASFIDNITTLDGILQHLNQLSPNVRIGNLYVVTHASSNGHLLFGLDAGDKNTATDPDELREAVEKKTLSAPGVAIDSASTIHIKGCNIGQNENVVNLIDVAFGAAGTVIAPTHEQVFGHVGTTYYESLSGPTIQRPGSKKFTLTEIQKIVDTRYTHLDKNERVLLAKELFQAQVVENRDIPIEKGNIPQNEKQAIAFFQPHTSAYTLKKLIKGPTIKADYYEYLFEIQLPNGSIETVDMGIDIKGESTALTEAQQGETVDIGDYSWNYSKTIDSKTGNFSTAVRMTRVIAYLYQRILDAKSGQRLTPPLSNPEFYTTSTAK